MRGTMPRCWLGLAVLTLTAMPAVWGQEPSTSTSLQKAIVPPPAATMEKAHEADHAHDEAHEHEICPPEEEHHGHFFARAEYLLMQPRRRDLDIAIIDPNRDGLPQGSIESLNWEADSGVRAGGGYRLEDGWEFGGYYTYFYSATQRSISAPPGGTLYATLTHPGFVDAVDTAAGSSRFKYQVLDLELGKRLKAGESFEIWLGGGGRYAWINQQLNASYDGQSAFLARVSSPLDFTGGGLRVGADADWKIARGFGLYGRAFGSLLAGDIRADLTETNNNGGTVITRVQEKFHKVIPVAEMGLGVSWHNETFAARVGYELTNWFGLVDSPDFIHDYTNKLGHRIGDLSLDGLSVRVEVGF